jgi:copper chaperone NosL
MTLLRFACLVTALTAPAAILASCGGGGVIEPPAILYGRDECEECRMIISDERYAAALVIAENGAFRGIPFDDIGCLLAYERGHAEASIAARYVRDAAGTTWLDAASGSFLHSPSLETPMAFGVAALATPDVAAQWRQKHGGEILDITELYRRFDSGQLRFTFHAKGQEP